MAAASSSPVPSGSSSADTSWFVHDRFGLFIHWGLYAMGARHEWLMNNESIPVEEYERKYFKHFDPDLYDPARWADAAADAGMKYFVVTTKHHDGFCLWDTKLTDYKAPNTPAKRDLLRPMVDAFRARGIRTGLYHSIIDWHHPHYVIDDRFGPYRALPPEKRAEMNAGRDQAKYAEYLHGQVRELLTGYGPVDVLWFDFSYRPPKDVDQADFTRGKGRLAWQSEKLLKMIRELAPHCMVTDRLDLNDQPVDFRTPEQYQPRAWMEHNGRRVVWEACQTLSGSWGYHRDEASWRSPDELIRTLIDCVSKGGNLLLNVGPTGRGEFDHRALHCLSEIGKWMRVNGRSIYGCTEAPEGLRPPVDGRLTYNADKKRLYVHLFAYPYKHLHLDGLLGKVEYAQFLHDGSELRWKFDDWTLDHMKRPDDTLVLQLPQVKPNVAVPVVELFLK
jgi:alpha-L-fucosidase